MLLTLRGISEPGDHAPAGVALGCLRAGLGLPACGPVMGRTSTERDRACRARRRGLEALRPRARGDRNPDGGCRVTPPTLLLGDCLERLAEVDRAIVDLVLAATAAIQCRRRFVGIELDPDYHATAIRRIQAAV